MVLPWAPVVLPWCSRWCSRGAPVGPRGAPVGVPGCSRGAPVGSRGAPVVLPLVLRGAPVGPRGAVSVECGAAAILAQTRCLIRPLVHAILCACVLGNGATEHKWPTGDLSELLRRLEEGSFTADAHVQRIIAAGTVLLAPPSRERLPNLRHRCSGFLTPPRVEGSRAFRPVKELCDDLSDVLRRKASDVLRSRAFRVSVVTQSNRYRLC